MTYDPDLAARIRLTLQGRSVREVKMFGGLSFMVDDRLAVSATNQGSLMVRCNPDKVSALLRCEGAHWPQMRGKPMSKGWIVVDSSAVQSDEALREWIDQAVAEA